MFIEVSLFQEISPPNLLWKIVACSPVSYFFVKAASLIKKFLWSFLQDIAQFELKYGSKTVLKVLETLEICNTNVRHNPIKCIFN